MLEQLLKNLYQALSRDPQGVPALRVVLTPLGGSVPSSYWVRIEDDHLTGTAQVEQDGGKPEDPLTGWVPLHQNLRLNLHTTGTLGDLVTAINATPGFHATLLEGVNPDQSATALVEGSFDLLQQSDLQIYTSLLWGLLKPMAWLLVRAREEGDSGLAQSQPGTAMGQWLNTLGDLYGYQRFAGENDDRYRTRLLYEVIRPRANNVAMEEYLRYSLDMADVTVTDTPPGTNQAAWAETDDARFRFYVNLTLKPGLSFSLTLPQITSIVNRIKAWGVIWQINLIAQDLETWLVEDLIQTAVRLIITPPSPTIYDITLSQANAQIHVTQSYTESLRAPGHFLKFDTLVDDGGHTITTDDQDVILLDDSLHWRSWAEQVVDIWHPIIDNTIESETWDIAAAAVVHQAYKLAQSEDALQLVRNLTAVYQMFLRMGTTLQPIKRWKQFRSDAPFITTDDLNFLVDADRDLTPGGWLPSVGDVWRTVLH